jgi:hypothetical protein
MIYLQNFKEKYKDRTKDELIEELWKSYNEKEKLERQLKKYKNPHTPSSKQGFDKPQAQGIPVGRKLGKKSGHKGKTRVWDKPTQTIEVTASINPSNDSRNIVKTGEYEERIITDFKIEKTVKLYKVYYYRDLGTGEVFRASHTDLPNKGIFGKNIIALANLLHFENRVTVAGVASIFTNVFEIPMTPPTALDICTRGANMVSHKYEGIGEKLKASQVVNADETGSNQNGKSEWLWGFFTSALAFFVFFPRRGGDILESVLGKNFKGILGCDGWSTYKVFSDKHGILLQRCWAHLIREVKYICKDVKDLDAAYVWIKDIFEKVKKARELKTERIRQKKYHELIAELDQWTQVYSTYKQTRDLVTLVKNGQEFWFTCILHPEIEPTNNRAERGIRKFVILEKIMGCLRSEQGKKTTQIMMSLFGTWKLQGINPYKELRAIL